MRVRELYNWFLDGYSLQNYLLVKGKNETEKLT